jgi:hypothetical protein
MRTKPDDFEDWQYPKPGMGDSFGKGFRFGGPERGQQVCIEGKWRP